MRNVALSKDGEDQRWRLRLRWMEGRRKRTGGQRLFIRCFCTVTWQLSGMGSFGLRNGGSAGEGIGDESQRRGTVEMIFGSNLMESSPLRRPTAVRATERISGMAAKECYVINGSPEREAGAVGPPRSQIRRGQSMLWALAVSLARTLRFRDKFDTKPVLTILLPIGT